MIFTDAPLIELQTFQEGLKPGSPLAVPALIGGLVIVVCHVLVEVSLDLGKSPIQLGKACVGVGIYGGLLLNAPNPFDIADITSVLDKEEARMVDFYLPIGLLFLPSG
jgi:hypothetical protein